jgi:hypothetical protein
VTTLAGLVGSAGIADGTGSDARFNHPFGVAVDSAGNIWATGPGGVRIITPRGKVLGQLIVPETVANVAFAEDGKTVYLTGSRVVLALRRGSHRDVMAMRFPGAVPIGKSVRCAKCATVSGIAKVCSVVKLNDESANVLTAAVGMRMSLSSLHAAIAPNTPTTAIAASSVLPRRRASVLPIMRSS